MYLYLFLSLSNEKETQTRTDFSANREFDQPKRILWMITVFVVVVGCVSSFAEWQWDKEYDDDNPERRVTYLNATRAQQKINIIKMHFAPKTRTWDCSSLLCGSLVQAGIDIIGGITLSSFSGS